MKYPYTTSYGTYRDPSADRIVMLETNSIVNGWRVRTKYIQTSPQDAKARRDTVAWLIVRSILEQETKKYIEQAASPQRMIIASILHVVRKRARN